MNSNRLYESNYHQQWRLHIHNNISGARFTLASVVQEFDHPIRSLTFSRDDAQLAVATERYVAVIDTAGFGRWRYITLDGSLHVNSRADVFNTQAMAFTPDGAFLCLSTRVRPSGDLLMVPIETGSGEFQIARRPIKSTIDGVSRTWLPAAVVNASS